MHTNNFSKESIGENSFIHLAFLVLFWFWGEQLIFKWIFNFVWLIVVTIWFFEKCIRARNVQLLLIHLISSTWALIGSSYFIFRLQFQTLTTLQIQQYKLAECLSFVILKIYCFLKLRINFFVTLLPHFIQVLSWESPLTESKEKWVSKQKKSLLTFLISVSVYYFW